MRWTDDPEGRTAHADARLPVLSMKEADRYGPTAASPEGT